MLTPDGAGSLVRLRHSGLGAAGGAYREGWGHHLPRLDTTAAGGDPGPDPLADPSAMQI